MVNQGSQTLRAHLLFSTLSQIADLEPRQAPRSARKRVQPSRLERNGSPGERPEGQGLAPGPPGRSPV